MRAARRPILQLLLHQARSLIKGRICKATHRTLCSLRSVHRAAACRATPARRALARRALARRALARRALARRALARRALARREAEGVLLAAVAIRAAAVGVHREAAASRPVRAVIQVVQPATAAVHPVVAMARQRVVDQLEMAAVHLLAIPARQVVARQVVARQVVARPVVARPVGRRRQRQVGIPLCFRKGSALRVFNFRRSLQSEICSRCSRSGPTRSHRRQSRRLQTHGWW